MYLVSYKKLPILNTAGNMLQYSYNLESKLQIFIDKKQILGGREWFVTAVKANSKI
jgi:hypothetical protein